MTVTRKSPRKAKTASVVIDPGAVGSLIEPISVITEAVSTRSVEIDIATFVRQQEQSSDDFVLGVFAPNQKIIMKAIGKLIGGAGFLYELEKDRAGEGLYTLRVISRIGPLQVTRFATFFQTICPELRIYVEGNPVTAL